MARIERRSNIYRGGWSTSISGDLFGDPRRRSSCCALACCGLLLSDRNAHLVMSSSSEDEETRPSWWKRFCWNLGMPIGTLLVLNVLQTFLATDETEDLWNCSIAVSMFFVISALLWRAKRERIQVRRKVMERLYQKRRGELDASEEDNTEAFLQLHMRDIRRAHATCWCYPNDIMRMPEGLVSEQTLAPPRDLCSCLWSCLSNTCTCCSASIQCCGMCAIGQEDREIQRLLPKADLQVDYITFQAYAEYYPAILELRQNQNHSLVAHWSALSLLSYNLVKMFVTSLLILTVVALLQLDPKFQLPNLIVVLATFGQAFLILYLIHWCGNKFDLSLDALIKFFASGFCLCPFLAIIYEMIISSLLSHMQSMIEIIGISEEVTETMSPQKIQQLADFRKEHVGIFSVFAFLNAFVVAATVEEMCKYFGYWMVETPDLMDPDELVLDEELETTESKKRTLLSRAAGITIAMVATAAGFACSENLLYVFIYTPPNLDNEIATLVARSMFPIHPLAAALQSLGVVRRDLLFDQKWQLGRIMFSAILLHGSFDFCLMLLNLLQSSAPETTTDDGYNVTDDATRNDTTVASNKSELVPLISVSMVMISLAFYFCESASQRKRLQEAVDKDGQAAAAEGDFL